MIIITIRLHKLTVEFQIESLAKIATHKSKKKSVIAYQLNKSAIENIW